MSAFPCRCISCGRLHVEPVEWCPEPCHTDLRDSNNRVYVGRHCLDPEVCNWPSGRCVEPSRCEAPLSASAYGPELRKLIADWWPMRHDGFGERLTLRSLIRTAKRQSGQTLVEIAVALAIIAILVVCVLLLATNT